MLSLPGKGGGPSIAGTSWNPKTKSVEHPQPAPRSPAAGGPGGAAAGWQPPAYQPPTASAVPRPDLQPINPAAAYDPEMAAALASQRGYTEQLQSGTGHVMDVMTQRMADNLEAQVVQAKASAAAAGIPFDEASFRAQGQRDINAGLAQEKLGRESQIGQSIGASTAAAAGQAGERTSRMGIDLQAQMGTGAQKLDRYGIDVQKYGIDTGAAVSANNALLDFYSRLMGGMFSQSMTSNTSYG